MNLTYVVITLLVVILILLIWYFSTLNKINRTIIKIEESLSGIDVALSKRYNVLTKMIEVVKGYAKHEKEILFEVVKLRKDSSIEEKNKVNKIMDENYKKINVIVENYPTIKSNENFMMLQQSIVEVEEHLQAARRVYNSNISIYNQLIASFPTSIIANGKKMLKKDFFEADELAKENIKIKL